jgi:hypothetical protein
MLTTQRLTALLLTALAPLAVAGTSAAQVPGPATARTSVLARGPSHRGLPERYPAMRKAVPLTVWVPGHEVERTRRVWVPGRTRQEWVAPRLATRYDACGRPYTVCLRAGHWRTICEPGHYETRVERVRIPGRWERRFR